MNLDGLKQLSPRERELLVFRLDGMTDQEIAAKACMSHKTVNVTLSHARIKLGLPERSPWAWLRLARALGRMEGVAEERRRHER